MPVLAGATADGPSAFLVATPTGPVLLISDVGGSFDDAKDLTATLAVTAPQLPVLIFGMPLTLVGSFDG